LHQAGYAVPLNRIKSVLQEQLNSLFYDHVIT
jgi:hypothetical protein